MYFLGIDVGSSSVKASIVDAVSRKTLATVHSPQTEMDMISMASGWAEQDPAIWWDNLILACQQLKAEGIDLAKVAGIGISYQMHGLVVVDDSQQVLRPAIIWCDSRAVDIGQKAFEDLGEKVCLKHLLNSPGNFTASKLKWVQLNEPETYNKIYKMLLPGDYINMMITGEINTTVSGLSEGMLWDFEEHKPATLLMDYYGIDHELIPELVPTCSVQGRTHKKAAEQLGVPIDTPVCYRAGDQPNNALSLNVLNPGEVAGTGGTSGVIYGVVDQNVSDTKQRVNTFAHVNHHQQAPSLGVLLCINGAGILYKYIRQLMGSDLSYSDLEEHASSVPVNSQGLQIIPFGNGAERMLSDTNVKASVLGLEFNRHGKSHFFRAALEGIAYSFTYGLEVFQELGLNTSVIKVGNDNLFQSRIFAETVAILNQAQIQVVDSTGAVGAALACAYSLKQVEQLSDALGHENIQTTYQQAGNRDQYLDGYESWKSNLNIN